MKKITGIFMLVALLFTTACNNDTKEAKEEPKVETNTNAIADKTYIVSNKESAVKWEASAVAHGHNGTVNVIAGKFEVTNGKISAGKVSIDMTSIDATDMEEGSEDKAKLEGHLNAEDFFHTAEYPVANLEITDATNMDAVKGNLTIKDKTHEIVFPLSISKEGEMVKISSDFSFDRTKYGITYNSGNFFENLGDKMIKDKVNMSVALMAK